MKKIMLFVVAAIAVTTVGCSYDDSSIWEKFGEVDKRIEQNSRAIESLKDAVANNLSVVDVTQTEEGYILTLSDGSTITLYHGTDGTNGTDGKDGESMISDIDLSDPDYVVITLTDGTTITLARYDSETPIFNILYDEATAIFEFGSSQEFVVEADNILNYTISKPEGWRVAYQENLLTICSPSKEACCFEKEGTVAVTAVSEAGKSVIATLDVMVGEWVEDVTLRPPTFEDRDARPRPYPMEYASAEINTWSDLIDDVQYGGLLTYANYAEEIYFWQDEANTELCHSFLTPYWGGGHAISNYIIEDYTTLPEGHYGWYELQFSIPIHGHNNSSNFCIHNGYKDSFNTSIYDPTLATIAFMDGQARVVDHMWVTNTCYVLTLYYNITLGNIKFGSMHVDCKQTTSVVNHNIITHGGTVGCRHHFTIIRSIYLSALGRRKVHTVVELFYIQNRVYTITIFTGHSGIGLQRESKHTTVINNGTVC